MSWLAGRLPVRLRLRAAAALDGDGGGDADGEGDGAERGAGAGLVPGQVPQGQPDRDGRPPPGAAEGPDGQRGEEETARPGSRRCRR